MLDWLNTPVLVTYGSLFVGNSIAGFCSIIVFAGIMKFIQYRDDAEFWHGHQALTTEQDDGGEQLSLKLEDAARKVS